LVVIPLLLGVIGRRTGQDPITRQRADRRVADVERTQPARRTAEYADDSGALVVAGVNHPNWQWHQAFRWPARPEAKASLLEALKAGFGPNINIIDNLRINPDITSLDFSHATALFKAAASVPDFGLAVKGDTVTLTGTAGSGDQQEAIEQAADAAWPNLNIVDTMGINGPVTSSGPPSPAPASPAPAPAGAANACANLSTDIKTLGPVTFPTNGFSLTPAAEQTLKHVADKLKACASAKVTINGYTDNTGNDAINMPLSANRANAVADYLIARGVTGDQLMAKGLGSANPVADNGGPDGQAKNRRVEITVS
jgi:peptidoglycan-binding protein ArfA